MSPRESVLQQALALSPDDQMFVALALGDHLIPPEIPEEQGLSGDEFLEELKRRSARYLRGESQARDVEDVMRDMRERQAREAAP